MSPYRSHIFWILTLSAALIYSGIRLLIRWPSHFAVDFAVNWVAAHGLLHGVSLYDWPTLHVLSEQLLPQTIGDRFTYLYGSYISTPFVAVLLLPLAGLSFADSLLIFRLITLISFLTAVILTGIVVPPPHRRLATLVGITAVLTFNSVIGTLSLGQTNALVMLPLSLALLFMHRRQYTLTGFLLAIAALLKLSPAIIILYYLIRGRWQLLVGALSAVLLLVSLLALLDRSQDMLIFVSHVLPRLSAGTMHVDNQSMPAWLSRLLTGSTNLLSFSNDLGYFRLLSPILVCAILAGLWYLKPDDSSRDLEFAILILAALVAAPLTWDHYTCWTIIPLILIIGRRNRSQFHPSVCYGLLVLLGAGALLLAAPFPYYAIFAEGNSAAHWWFRVVSGMKTLGSILWLAVAFALLAGSHRSMSHSRAFVSRPRNSNAE